MHTYTDAWEESLTSCMEKESERQNRQHGDNELNSIHSENRNSLKLWVWSVPLLSIKSLGLIMANSREHNRRGNDWATMCTKNKWINKTEERTFSSRDKFVDRQRTTSTIPYAWYYYIFFSFVFVWCHSPCRIYRIIFPYAHILSTWRDLWRKEKQQTNGLPLSGRTPVCQTSAHGRNCPQNTNIFFFFVSSVIS